MRGGKSTLICEKLLDPSVETKRILRYAGIIFAIDSGHDAVSENLGSFVPVNSLKTYPHHNVLLQGK